MQEHAKKKPSVTQKQLRAKARDVLAKALAGARITRTKMDLAIGVLHLPERNGE